MELSFHGAAREVTGSCFLLKAQDNNKTEHQFLIDCGMFQGEHLCSNKNMEPFKFDPKQIEAVFVTHPHADHTGRIPKLFSAGFHGPIYMTPPCVGLSKLVLEDAHHIMKEEAEKCGSSVLYEMEDLLRAFDSVKAVSYHQQIDLAPGISIMFHEAGHVLGSSFISVEAEGKRLVFSGDIGNDDVPILPETETISHADIVICESTYGHRVHEPMQERESKLRAAIEQMHNNRSVLLIPAFSIERTQELLYAMNHILEKDLKVDCPIFLDSPMAIRATQLYRDFKEYLKFDSPILQESDRDFFSFKNLRETLTVPESKMINDTPAPKAIIAGSGMMSGGRIMHHLIRYLPDPKTILLIIGYQAKGTLGRKIYEGASKVVIFGEEVRVNAQTIAIGAFSAHGDMNKLTRWLHPDDGEIPKKIFLVHGDIEAKEVFATHLRHELRTEVVIPEYQYVYSI